MLQVQEKQNLTHHYVIVYSKFAYMSYCMYTYSKEFIWFGEKMSKLENMIVTEENNSIGWVDAADLNYIVNKMDLQEIKDDLEKWNTALLLKSFFDKPQIKANLIMRKDHHQWVLDRKTSSAKDKKNAEEYMLLYNTIFPNEKNQWSTQLTDNNIDEKNIFDTEKIWEKLNMTASEDFGYKITVWAVDYTNNKVSVQLKKDEQIYAIDLPIYTVWNTFSLWNSPLIPDEGGTWYRRFNGDGWIWQHTQYAEWDTNKLVHTSEQDWITTIYHTQENNEQNDNLTAISAKDIDFKISRWASKSQVLRYVNNIKDKSLQTKAHDLLKQKPYNDSSLSYAEQVENKAKSFQLLIATHAWVKITEDNHDDLIDWKFGKDSLGWLKKASTREENTETTA